MALVGNIAIGTGVNLKPLLKQLNAAANAVGGFASTIVSPLGNAARGIAGLGSAAAGLGLAAAGASSLSSLTASCEESISANSDLANRLGTTTEGLVGLQHGANLAGVETGTLNAAITKMQVNLSNAAAGMNKLDVEGTGAAATLAKLGINAKEWKGQDASESFREVAQAISLLKDPADRAAAAVSIFGKAGAGLGNLLMEGGAGIDAAIEDAKRLGLTYTNEQAAMVESAGDAKDRLGSIFTAIGNQIVIGIAPGVEWLANSLTDIWAFAVEWAGGVQDTITSFAEATNNLLLSWGIDVMAIFEGVGMVIRNLPAFIEIARIKITEIMMNIGESIGTLMVNFATLGDWLANNWSKMIVDALNYVKTIFVNFGTNVGGFFKALFASIFSGDPFEFEWTDLMKGFKATTAQLPEMVKTEFTSLQSEIDTQVASIATREAERAKAKTDAVKKEAMKEPVAGKKKKEKEAKMFGDAVEFGSAEAFDNVLKFRGLGGGGDSMADVAKTSADSLDVQKKILATLERQGTGTAEAGMEVDEW